MEGRWTRVMGAALGAIGCLLLVASFLPIANVVEGGRGLRVDYTDGTWRVAHSLIGLPAIGALAAGGMAVGGALKLRGVAFAAAVTASLSGAIGAYLLIAIQPLGRAVDKYLPAPPSPDSGTYLVVVGALIAAVIAALSLALPRGRYAGRGTTRAKPA